MDFHAMEISFPIDEQIPLWRFKPGNYLTDIIGYEGAGSLHSFLKDRGWITTLSAGVQDLARGFATFKITLYLSQNGFREPTASALHRSPDRNPNRKLS
jgi:insulysin